MSKQSGQLRIIGGEWRGRKLSFPTADDLRPTPDRVRETLFNWLQGIIEGARCLDLFAGSGALGLEALSRGASEVVFVEQNPRVADQIRQHLITLNSTCGRVITSDAFSFLRGPVTPFDVIFLDPPYRLDCLTQCCELLTERGWLKDGARIYLESPSKQGPPALPPNWNLLRSKTAGDVGYHLATVPQA
ncbi:MAG: 16S rRNA (guanine(966)-N(2))-methyltransferase RsmD [Gammaproteobacteria bacterium]|nr:16S rRNA (guanine(966)-N(2))-methyltransferase RsmD [Gammaproteobacteria bacterium]